jgi:Fur family ferric uptake transcriptional regulator
MTMAGSPSPLEQFVAFLRGQGLRLTPQRRALVQTVFNPQQHFNAEQLLAWARLRDKSVSRATVYRTLPLLVESGLLRKTDLGRDLTVYDPNYVRHPHHNHLVCRNCGKVLEFESEEVQLLAEKLGRRLGFATVVQRLQIVGDCEQLKATGACRHLGGLPPRESRQC